jgi:hypothetical protein
MPRVVKRSASHAVKAGSSRRGAALPQFVTPQLSLLVEKPPSGPQWVHEIKLDDVDCDRIGFESFGATAERVSSTT